MNYRYSLHKIYNKDECPFNEADYSRFKFGDVFYAKKFADEMFENFIKEHDQLILNQSDIVLLPSPYHSIPTASNYLCHFFKINLNSFLFKNGRNACTESKIHRNQTYTEDYGNMDYFERINLISNDTYHIDRDFIKSKFCIFLDDIKITGSHEQTVNKILESHNVNGDFLFIYFAELSNREIHPNIENYYNYFSVKSLKDLINIISSKSFKFNTRIIKYVFLLNDLDFQTITDSLSANKKIELMNLVISNNYHQKIEFKNNVKNLTKQLWPLTYKKDNERVSMLQNSPSV
jgi:hypothetical protein